MAVCITVLFLWANVNSHEQMHYIVILWTIETKPNEEVKEKTSNCQRNTNRA